METTTEHLVGDITTVWCLLRLCPGLSLASSSGAKSRVARLWVYELSLSDSGTKSGGSRLWVRPLHLSGSGTKSGVPRLWVRLLQNTWRCHKNPVVPFRGEEAVSACAFPESGTLIPQLITLIMTLISPYLSPESGTKPGAGSLLVRETASSYIPPLGWVSASLHFQPSSFSNSGTEICS